MEVLSANRLGQDGESCYLRDGHWRFRSEAALALILHVQHMARFTPN